MKQSLKRCRENYLNLALESENHFRYSENDNLDLYLENKINIDDKRSNDILRETLIEFDYISDDTYNSCYYFYILMIYSVKSDDEIDAFITTFFDNLKKIN
tara:strand:- start:237 stop:539 length:303 start_codon:yes stop_codon:yes gene_type:complete